MKKNNIFASLFGIGKKEVEQPSEQPTPQPTPQSIRFEMPVANYIDGEDILEMDWEEGTKKQQTWANKLVKEFLKEIKGAINDAVKENAITQEQADLIKKEVNKNIIYQDDANWWIDNQYMNIRKKMLVITSASEDLEKIIKRVAY